MRKHAATGIICGLVAVIALSGCASKGKNRIALLEVTNRDLTERLNAAHAQLRAAGENDNQLNDRLQAALADAENLRSQLVNLPTPQEAAPGWTAVPGGAMIAIEGSVLFQPGRASLRPAARKTLDAIASTVQGEYADKDVLVVGHTDNQPIKKSGWTDNHQLSAERALAVMRYLLKRGVEPTRLLAAGAGEHRPVQDNASAASRSVNRRVEIFAINSLP